MGLALSVSTTKFAFLNSTPRTRSKHLKRALGYVCAVLFAWFTADVSMRYSAFRGTPLALSFAAVAVITTESGNHLHPFRTALMVELPLVARSAERPLSELEGSFVTSNLLAGVTAADRSA